MALGMKLHIGCALMVLAGAVSAWAVPPERFRFEGSEAFGPPYPTEGHASFGLLTGEGDLLPAVQHSELQIKINEALCDGSVKPASLTGSDNGGGREGSMGYLNFLLGEAFAASARGSLNFGFLLPASMTEQGTSIVDFSWGENFFDVFAEVTLLGDGSVRKYNIHGDIGDAQPVKFTDVVASPGSVNIAFDLALTGAGAPQTDNPLVTMTLTGEVVPEPAAAMLLMLAAGFVPLRRRHRA